MALGTAERIRSVARQILSDEGEAAVTMRRVATEVGVTAMALYRHFPDRAALLDAVAGEVFAELGEKWGRRPHSGGTDDQLFALLDDFLDFALGSPHVYTFVMTDRRSFARRFPDDFRSTRSPALGPLVEFVERRIRDGAWRRDDAVEIAQCIAAQTIGLVQLYVGGRVHLSEPEFRELCRRGTERLVDGLRARPVTGGHP